MCRRVGMALVGLLTWAAAGSAFAGTADGRTGQPSAAAVGPDSRGPVIEKLEDENARLRSQVARLRAQIQSLGAVPDGDATTAPASTTHAKPRSTMFILATGERAAWDQMKQAARELEPTQFFNAIALGNKEIVFFQKSWVPATEAYKKKCENWGSPMIISGSWSPLFFEASKVKPEVIWFLTNGHEDNEDAFMFQVRKALAGSRTRINTSTAFMSYFNGPKDYHLMWRLAHDTGGVCVDSHGEQIDEPTIPVPAVPVAPAPEAPKPSILKDGGR